MRRPAASLLAVAIGGILGACNAFCTQDPPGGSTECVEHSGPVALGC